MKVVIAFVATIAVVLVFNVSLLQNLKLININRYYEFSNMLQT